MTGIKIDLVTDRGSTQPYILPNGQSLNDKDTAPENSTYHSTINSTSVRITDIVREHIELLDRRAQAYGMLADFKNAMTDAEQMIHLDPSSPRGYIRAGELYSMRGNQLQAMEVYIDGLEKVNDEYYRDILEQSCAVAEAKAEQRIDIFAMMPYDIIACITDHFPLKESLTLLEVSPIWRSKLLECVSLWSDICLSEKTKWAPHDISRLALASRVVLNLRLLALDRNRCALALSQIATSDFASLTSLSIDGCWIPDANSLLRAINRVASTLKKLTISDYRFGCTPSKYALVPYKTIITTCPNLEELKYHHRIDVQDDLTGFLTPGVSSKLTKLDLSFKNYTVMSIRDVVIACPNLRCLSLGHCLESYAVRTILHYCKRLVHFEFNKALGDYISGDDIQESGIMEPVGIRRLMARIDDPYHFTTLFAEHCTTIEALLLVFQPIVRDQTWDSLMTACSFTNLRDLCVKHNEDISNGTVISVLKQSPALSRLRIDSSIIGGYEITSAIAQLPLLQRLEIAEGVADDQAMQHLFLALAARPMEQSALEYLSISATTFEVDEVLDGISGILTLKTFALQGKYDIPTESLNRFCIQLRPHPRIESIRLSFLKGVTDSTLEHLAHIKQLKELYLSYLGDITSEGLKPFDTSVKLTIWKCDRIQSKSRVRALS
ncbi:hypothetical protein BJV82DRAFT_636962 [Fennellomyces sp. T-0311]|nr:hypothetical protein BJV82DRAFT_636962 [Fennellomyces sp. T-0311]